jgi:hypothetical protein
VRTASRLTSLILPGNQLRIAYVISDEGRPTRDVEVGWRLEFIPTDTGWYVDPIRAHMLPEIGAVSVTPAGKPVTHLASRDGHLSLAGGRLPARGYRPRPPAPMSVGHGTQREHPPRSVTGRLGMGPTALQRTDGARDA